MREKIGPALPAAALVGLLLTSAVPAAGQATRPGMRGAVPAPAASAGLCQCIDNQNTIEQTCQWTPDACQSACGASHYSFVPYAVQSCAAPR